MKSVQYIELGNMLTQEVVDAFSRVGSELEAAEISVFSHHGGSSFEFSIFQAMNSMESRFCRLEAIPTISTVVGRHEVRFAVVHSIEISVVDAAKAIRFFSEDEAMNAKTFSAILPRKCPQIPPSCCSDSILDRINMVILQQ